MNCCVVIEITKRKTVLEKLSSSENLPSIPEDFNTAEFVTSSKKTEEVAEVSRSLQKVQMTLLVS